MSIRINPKDGPDEHYRGSDVIEANGLLILRKKDGTVTGKLLAARVKEWAVLNDDNDDNDDED